MSHLVIAGTTFSGLIDGTGNASAWQPTGYSVKERKIGVTLEAADGTRNRVERSTYKRVWEIEWAVANAATVTTLRAINALTSTFTFTDTAGTSYTVQTEDELEVDFAFIVGSTQYWSVRLTLYQH